MTTTSFEALLYPEDPTFSTAWAEVFLNSDFVRQLIASSDRALIEQVCAAGLHWDGAGWTTARTTVTMYELNKVALVSDDIQDYLLAFLFAVSLAAGVDVPSLKRND